MNSAQERIARTLAARTKKALKDAQTGSGVAPTSGSGDSSSGSAVVALSPALVSSKRRDCMPMEVSTLLRKRGNGCMD